MKSRISFNLFLICTLFSCQLIAQGSSDSTAIKKSIAFARTQYTKNIGAASYLYNGTAYVRYWNGVRGNPFFFSEEFQQGGVVYGGILYTDIPLQYDIARDELVTKTFSKETDIKLVSEKITAFSIGKNRFVRIVADSSVSGNITTGFYKQLYKGVTAAYAKHEKRIEKSVKAEDNFSIFIQYDKYYLEKDGVFHIIDGEGSLISALKDQRQEIRKFLGRKEVNYRKDPEGAIVQTAAFYDRLKK